MVPPPPVLRVLYRSILRTTQNGRYPELLGPYGYKAWSVLTTEDNAKKTTIAVKSLPKDPTAVRSLLHQAFESHPLVKGEQPDEKHGRLANIDPFDLLRQSAVLSSIAAAPNNTELPPRLAIFDYPPSTLLPWEQTVFNFFEPRYRRLAKDAVVPDNDGTSRGYFILRAGKGGVSSLMKILRHEEMPNGNIETLCISGPRLAISEEDSIDVIGSSHPLAIAKSFDIVRDEELGGESQLEALDLREQCIELISGVYEPFDQILEERGLPPVDLEAFSFWALHLLLAAQNGAVSDARARQQWLECKSTKKRLSFVVKNLRHLR